MFYQNFKDLHFTSQKNVLKFRLFINKIKKNLLRSDSTAALLAKRCHTLFYFPRTLRIHWFHIFFTMKCEALFPITSLTFFLYSLHF